jgi:hypothetical protein
MPRDDHRGGDQASLLDPELAEALSSSLLPGFGEDRDTAYVEKQRAAAAVLRAAGLHFFAGWACANAMHAAWGDIGEIRELADAARGDYLRAIELADPSSAEGIAGLKALADLAGRDFGGWFAGQQDQHAAVRAINEELAQRLLSLGRASPEHAGGILVRGLIVNATPRGEWAFSYPKFEVDSGTTLFGPSGISLNIPSAFHLFVRLQDWVAAEEVAKLEEESFTTPGLRGWRTAVTGLLDPDQAVECFDKAASIFASDTPPTDEELAERGGSWNSRNIHLWAKFFQARSLVARIGETPDQALELLQEAAQSLRGTESGWVNPQVSYLRIMTTALTQILTGDPHEAVQAARKAINFESRLHGADDQNAPAMEFLDAVIEAFQELRANPGNAVVSGSFPTALQLLGRIPLLNPEMPEALGPHVARKAGEEILGPVRTWVHRTLESITNESQLRQVLLRLHQSRSPVYAQIRHGPIEYGKDLVVLSQEGEEVILRMYQAKVGNITKTSWRLAQAELEEIFQVGLDSLQLPLEPSRREGVLVFNGHVNPYVEPVIQGWLDEQEGDHGRSYRLENLDALVAFITANGLANEFRAACNELGIAIVDALSERPISLPVGRAGREASLDSTN